MMDFLWRALLAGLLLALVCGPLGCFIVWRRMAYFGDTLAHSALLGISLGLLLEINLQLSVVLLCCILALLLVGMEQRRNLASDTILGILAHSALALGLVMLSFTDARIDLMAFLFGDLLSVGANELGWMALGTLAVLALLVKFWNPLLALTLHQELAQVEGLHTERLRLLLLLVMALVVAVAMKVVGILLITSLLIIPPAAARHVARSPEQMAIAASLIGTLAVLAGIAASWWLDTPTGPSIVVAAAVLFAVLSCLKARQA
ncbi:MAG TPA: zinc ABC transporter permease subunit ZnuB [Pseudomonadaceae bacterium]|nr:zinc ABC transporter permease subunit ZnuB [Pseudomonadaceae bacterium]